MLTRIMKCVAIVALLGAIMWPPQGGFQLFVQFAVTAAAILVVIQSFKVGRPGLAIVFIAVAALFNPLVPPALSRAAFLGIATASIGLFALALLTFRAQPRLSIASITDRTPGSESL
jgi:hypothetical protein